MPNEFKVKNGIITPTLQSTVATGTAPFTVASTTRVSNLNVATAGTADTLTTARNINDVPFNGSANISIPKIKTIDDRTLAPSEVTTASYTAAFGSWNNNNTAPYADHLVLRSYTDSSGGLDNMISFRKDTIGMRIWQQTFGSSTAFATYKDVAFTDSNITGSAATLTTARTLTIGNTGKTFNGSADVSWSLSEIGAPALSGGSVFTGSSSFRGFSIRSTDPNNNWSWFALGGTSDSAGNVWHVATNGLATDIGNAGAFHIRGNNGSFTSIAINQDHSVRFRSSSVFLGATTNSDGVQVVTNSGTWAINTTGSAATLTTTRTIWGQNFNGSANVTGAISGITTLSMNNQLTNTLATGTAPFVITSTTRVANLNVATAGTADTLTTARTLTIGNTGKTFNGSANVSWTVGEIGAESIASTGVPRGNLGDPTVREMALFDAQFTNKTDFYDIAQIFVETSTDNVNWTTYSVSDTDKRRLVGGDVSLSGLVIPYNTAYFRIRLRANSYVYLNALYMYASTNGHSTQMRIYKKHDSGSWTEHTSSTATVNIWPGHFYLPFSTIPWNSNATLGTHFHEVYVLFQPTWNPTYSANNINLYSMQWWGGYPSGKRNVFSTDENRNVSFPADCSAVNFNSTSDANKKEDVETIINSIELIVKMRGVSFTWKDTKAKSIGLIAQEVEDIIPEVVVTTNGIKTISYGNLVGLLVEGFKNHENRLTALESVIRAM